MGPGTSGGRALWQSGCCITVSQRRGTRREPANRKRALRAFVRSFVLSVLLHPSKLLLHLSLSPFSLCLCPSFLNFLFVLQHTRSRHTLFLLISYFHVSRYAVVVSSDSRSRTLSESQHFPFFFLCVCVCVCLFPSVASSIFLRSFVLF